MNIFVNNFEAVVSDVTILSNFDDFFLIKLIKMTIDVFSTDHDTFLRFYGMHFLLIGNKIRELRFINFDASSIDKNIFRSI